MALDGLVVRSMVNEFKTSLIGKKINKIFQYNPYDVIFKLSGTDLLISANPTYPRMHLTYKELNETDKIPNFCSMLRKHITGGIITNVYQVSLDRILILEILATNDFKEKVTLKLAVELMGRRSNVILIDESDVIIDSIRHVSEDMTRSRIVLPKRKYEFPPADMKYNLLSDFNMNELIEKNYHENETVISFFPKYFIGISKIVVEEFCKQYNIKQTEEVTYKLMESFKEFINIKKDETSYKIYFDQEGNTVDFHVCSLDIYSDLGSQSFDDINVLLEAFFKQKAQSNVIKQSTGDISNIIKSHMQKLSRKIELHKKSISDSSDMEKYKMIGDLLLANLYKEEKGSKEIFLENFYDDNKEIKINLDENLTLKDNANRYYKKYTRAKSTYHHAKEQLAEAESELAYLESLDTFLKNASSKDDIKNIKDELIKEGYLKDRDKSKNKKKKNISKPLCYRSKDGFLIYVGKSNIQNDEITFKIARENDLWFHTKDIPGSHVILKLDGKNPDDIPYESIEEAAMLSAFYSKGRSGSKIAVDYTQRKNVKKPNGAKPGFVIYLTNKTIYITPSEEDVKKIKLEN